MALVSPTAAKSPRRVEITEDSTLTGLPIKLALCAGFLLMQSLDVSAQEYVDVEAERRAAAQAVTSDVAEGGQ